jgi:hypothetical protein
LRAAHNTIIQADCTKAMTELETGSVDFVLTDPPYFIDYRDRDGRSVANDDNTGWLRPAFSQIYRVLKPASFCVSFYARNRIHLFRGAGATETCRPAVKGCAGMLAILAIDVSDREQLPCPGLGFPPQILCVDDVAKRADTEEAQQVTLTFLDDPIRKTTAGQRFQIPNDLPMPIQATVLHGPGPGCGRPDGDTHPEADSPPWNRFAVPFKHHAEHRHHISKPRYRVTNWAAYDAALKRRGSLTVWLCVQRRPHVRFRPG